MTLRPAALVRHRLVRAAAIVVGCWLLFRFGLPALSEVLLGKTVPTTAHLSAIYMLIVLIAAFLYASSDRAGWSEVTGQVSRLLTDDDPAVRRVRRVVLVALPLVIGWWSYTRATAAIVAPSELRTVHPAPPNEITFRGQKMRLQGAENPFRKDGQVDAQTVEAGYAVYVAHCMYCHGDALRGNGTFAAGLNPKPADFTDPGNLPQLQESYVFWRIAKGGPGLEDAAAPWSSAMPAWEDELDADQIWQVISYLYAATDFAPRSWEE